MLRSIIVALAVVIAAAVVSIKLLRPDPGPQQQSAGSGHLRATPAGDAQAIAKAPNPQKAPVQTFKVFASRDPFEPLVEDSIASTDDTGTAITDDTGGATDDAEVTAPDNAGGAVQSEREKGESASPEAPAREPGDDRSATQSRLRTSSASERLAVRLVAIRRGREAVVRIDGRLHRSMSGERFAENFELLSLGDGCASLLYGDEQFTLCSGQEILK
jgi:hypothetical protein